MNTSTITEQDKTSTPSSLMMKASVLYDIGRMEVRDVPRPAILPREVLVRVGAVGLCGTDAHIFSGHANYNTSQRGLPISLELQPQILGHEITGVIDEVGSLVDDLATGDRVVVDQGLNCLSRAREVLCEYCSTNDSHQCEFYREHGITGLPGGLAEYIAIPAVNAIRVNTALSFSESALVEPLGCVIHSSDRVAKTTSRYTLNPESTERRVRSVLICGAGPAGLLFTEYLRRVVGYDGSLMVSDPNLRKRDLARQLGADECIDASTSDIVEAVHDYTSGNGVEYVIEASGAGEAFSSIAQLIPRQATVLLYGHGHAGTDLSVLNNLLFKEPTIVTSVGASGGFDPDGRPSVYRRALNLIEEKRIDVHLLITHTYNSLADVESALRYDMHAENYVKGVVVL